MASWDSRPSRQCRQGYRQDEEQQERVPKNAQGRSTPFPKRLLAMIRREAVLNPLIVRWSLDGRAFFIDDDDIFVTDILRVYGFKASKMQSFQRNLNIYGFTRLTKGPYASGYVHPQFGRDTDDDQLEYIVRDSGKANCSNGGGDECTPKAKKVKYHQESRDGSNEGPGMRLTGGENACHSREHGSRRPGPALRAYPSYSSRDMNFSTSRVESTSALTEMRLAHQLMLEKDLMSQDFAKLIKPSNFWALPHAVYTSSSDQTVNTVVSTLRSTKNGAFDQLFVKKCVPAIVHI